MKIITQPNVLKGLAMMAAVNDVRYYLNGIAIQYVGGKLAIVATDGAAMVALEIVDGDEGNHTLARMTEAPGGVLATAVLKENRFIIGNDAIEKALKLAGKKEIEIVGTASENAPFNGSGQINVGGDDGISIPFQCVDGRFPDVGKVLSSRTTVEVCSFDGRLLERAMKAVATISGAGPKKIVNTSIATCGGSACRIVAMDGRLSMRVMPVRHDAYKEMKMDFSDPGYSPAYPQAQVPG